MTRKEIEEALRHAQAAVSSLRAILAAMPPASTVTVPLHPADDEDVQELPASMTAVTAPTKPAAGPDPYDDDVALPDVMLEPPEPLPPPRHPGLDLGDWKDPFAHVVEKPPKQPNPVARTSSMLPPRRPPPRPPARPPQSFGQQLQSEQEHVGKAEVPTGTPTGPLPVVRRPLQPEMPPRPQTAPLTRNPPPRPRPGTLLPSSRRDPEPQADNVPPKRDLADEIPW